ncbi:helix-turn-helix transcriptional regulator [Teredinibacter turnerae]|uniref:HTH domain protein n=1 Tax=Teredinibacter turnerae (strain ATCC 39867 / T7901) TaxID=377629 RepID=C5BNS8_TERTT|nr:YafY family protein [Teredinibacter turnerae]ACR13303.1 HTH domain protein [Teredinibacter turnerae T7901]
MRKAERLFQILNLLRNRRTVLTARQIAEQLAVSERTVYRDIQALSLSGVPIEGEAGVGYRLQRQFDLPPLMFDRDEVEALLLGARMIRAWSDRQLAAAASSALNKILAVLPPQLRELEETSAIKVPDYQQQLSVSVHSEQIRAAIRSQQKIAIDYEDAQAQLSHRCVLPLGLFFWGATWTLVGWCELRLAYRAFRLDRIRHFELLAENFACHASCSLDHYLALQRQRYDEYMTNANDSLAKNQGD